MIKKKLIIFSMIFLVLFSTSVQAVIIDDQFVGGAIVDSETWSNLIIDDEFNIWDSNLISALLDVILWSPQNTTYSTAGIWFNVSTGNPAYNCIYELNSEVNVSMTQLNSTWWADHDWVWKPDCQNNVTAYCDNAYGQTNSSQTVTFWACANQVLVAERVLW